MIIRASNIHKSFGNQKVLKGLTLEVHQGETLVILGRSGGGKSVLLRHIIGLEQPDKGTIEVFGKDLSTLDRKEQQELQKSIGMLFQNGALFDSLNIFQNTCFFLQEHGDPSTGKKLSLNELKERAYYALELVGLKGSEHKMPSELSGGMRKRAALARAIIYKPTILLYDEPTAGLDPVIAMQINLLIKRAKEELGATNIVVTHELKSALEIGDRFALHHDGAILHIAPKKEFFAIKEPTLRHFLENAIFPNPLEQEGS